MHKCHFVTVAYQLTTEQKEGNKSRQSKTRQCGEVFSRPALESTLFSTTFRPVIRRSAVQPEIWSNDSYLLDLRIIR